MQDLYRDRVLRHARDPANQQRLSCPDCTGQASNPLCGDQLAVDLKLKRGVIVAVGLGVRACALTSASASMMRAYLLQRQLAEARTLTQEILGAIVGKSELKDCPDCLQPLLALRSQSARLRCLELPWLAFETCAAKAAGS